MSNLATAPFDGSGQRGENMDAAKAQMEGTLPGGRQIGDAPLLAQMARTMFDQQSIKLKQSPECTTKLDAKGCMEQQIALTGYDGAARVVRDRFVGQTGLRFSLKQFAADNKQ